MHLLDSGLSLRSLPSDLLFRIDSPLLGIATRFLKLFYLSLCRLGLLIGMRSIACDTPPKMRHPPFGDGIDKLLQSWKNWWALAIQQLCSWRLRKNISCTITSHQLNLVETYRIL